ncbi:MAG: preprotein translocase subunit YajC [Tetrasphaera sp.]
MYSGLALAASQGSGVGSLLLLLLPLALLVFLMLGQRRRSRETLAMQQSLNVGDEVVTTAGMFGRIQALGDGEVDLEIAPGVIVRFDRRAIGARRNAADPPGLPAEPGAAEDPVADGPVADNPATGDRTPDNPGKES